jgi:hypothetical protein
MNKLLFFIVLLCAVGFANAKNLWVVNLTDRPQNVPYRTNEYSNRGCIGCDCFLGGAKEGLFKAVPPHSKSDGKPIGKKDCAAIGGGLASFERGDQTLIIRHVHKINPPGTKKPIYFMGKLLKYADVPEVEDYDDYQRVVGKSPYEIDELKQLAKKGQIKNW